MGGPWVYVPVTQPNLRQPTVPLGTIQSIVFDSHGRLFEAGMTRMMKPRLREGGSCLPRLPELGLTQLFLRLEERRPLLTDSMFGFPPDSHVES